MQLLVIVLLVLTAYRATRLIVKDTFPPVLRVRDLLAGGWRKLTLDEHEHLNGLDELGRTMTDAQWSVVRDPVTHTAEKRYVRRASWSPAWLSELITCPWCASAYVSGALTAVTDVTYGLPAPWLVGPAVWALAALLSSREWA